MSNTTSYPPHGLQTVAAFNYWIWSSFGQFLQISPHHSLLTYSFCSTSLVLDGMITAIREHFRCNNVSQIATDDNTPIVSYYLWKQKSGINHLDKCLKHIIGITWESAAVPSITMLIAVSLYYSNSVSNESSPLGFISSTTLVLTSDDFACVGVIESQSPPRPLLHPPHRQILHHRDIPHSELEIAHPTKDEEYGYREDFCR